MRVLLLVPVFLLSACGGGSSANNDSSGTIVPPVVQGPFIGGEFWFIGDERIDPPFLAAVAILSADGEVRIQLPDYSDTFDRPDNPVVYSQIVGRVSTTDLETWTSASIIGETCRSSSQQWGCGVAQPIDIRFSLWGDPEVVAELRGETSLGTGTFVLPMLRGGTAVDLVRDHGLWELYAYSSGASESAAPMTIDADGRVFFQSSATGCTGNGRLTPSGNGRVYSVELAVGNCGPEFENLNTSLAGLASYTAIDNRVMGGPSHALRFLLSSPEESVAPVALSMFAFRD